MIWRREKSFAPSRNRAFSYQSSSPLPGYYTDNAKAKAGLGVGPPAAARDFSFLRIMETSSGAKPGSYSVGMRACFTGGSANRTLRKKSVVRRG
jgi:hypothetical protein